MFDRSRRPRSFVPASVIAFSLTFCGVLQAQVDNVFPNTGNVGIGTTTPQAPLEIQTEGSAAILWDNGGAQLQNSDDFLLWDRGVLSILLDANNDETTSRFEIFKDAASSTSQTPVLRFGFEGLPSYIDSASNFGIGTANPGARFHIKGTLYTGVDNLDLLFNPSGSVHGLALKGEIAGNWSREFKFMAGTYNTLFGMGALVNNGTELKRGYIGGNSTANGVYDTPWMVFLPDGKVGIGLLDPTQQLSVAGTVESTTGGFKFPDGTVQSTAAVSGSSAFGASSSAPTNSLYVDQFGNVGIGTVYPGYPLAVVGNISASGTVISFGGGFQFPDGTVQTTAATGNRNSLDAADGAPLDAVYVDVAGKVGIGTTAPLTALDVRGTTTTSTLEVTGGADLSESFDVATGEEILPGMVVSIDPERPGGLRITQGEYDRTVAGVVSGAGGVQPGMVMGQSGTLAAGEHPIALTGRVYVYADASSGPIRPGDFLTTSSVPGHAMRVTNHFRAVGSILGKAMTPLEDGRGLVLVLMALQ